MFNVQTIYAEHGVENYQTGREVLARFPKAKVIRVRSHWQIPELAGDETNVEIWNKIKSEVLVLGVKKGLECRPNGRSTDFIAPSLSNGCYSSCVYCYNSRRKGFSNPTTVFVNTEEIHDTLVRHVKGQRPKTPNQCDPTRWTYDVGENSDCSLDAKLSSNVERTVRLFSKSQSAKVCFATKTVNRDMLTWDPKGNTRVRFSLMPATKSKLLDVRTSPVEDRIKAVSDFIEAGYEVHLNFSPVVVYDGWETDYADLLTQVRQTVSAKALAQLKCEVIFLTHNEGLHELNLRWHPKGEEVLWRPDLQEAKVSENGCQNLRYKYGLKGQYIQTFKTLLGKHLPECGIRYIF